MPIMPEMPDMSKLDLNDLRSEKCNLVSKYGKCPSDSQLSCNICALGSVKNYKEWKSQQKRSESSLLKWPMADKELFFVLPRVTMNAMPEKWKKIMVKLLKKFITHDFSDVFGDEANYHRNFIVRVTENGRFVKMPDVFKNFNK